MPHRSSARVLLALVLGSVVIAGPSPASPALASSPSSVVVAAPGHVKVVGIANCNTFTDAGIPWAIGAINVHFTTDYGETKDIQPLGIGPYQVDFDRVPDGGANIHAHVTCFMHAGPGEWDRDGHIDRNPELQGFDLKYKW